MTAIHTYMLDCSRVNLFSITLLLLGIKYVFERQYLQMFRVQLNK